MSDSPSKELALAEGVLTALPLTFSHDGHSFEIKHDRVIRDGRETCVLISPDFGAGWSTWCDKLKLFEPAVVVAILLGRKDVLLRDSRPFHEEPSDAFLQHIGGARDEVYIGGIRDLEVRYLPLGTAFTIEDYDGSESIRTLADMAYTA